MKICGKLGLVLLLDIVSSVGASAQELALDHSVPDPKLQLNHFVLSGNSIHQVQEEKKGDHYLTVVDSNICEQNRDQIEHSALKLYCSTLDNIENECDGSLCCKNKKNLEYISQVQNLIVPYSEQMDRKNLGELRALRSEIESKIDLYSILHNIRKNYVDILQYIRQKKKFPHSLLPVHKMLLVDTILEDAMGDRSNQFLKSINPLHDDEILFEVYRSRFNCSFSTAPPCQIFLGSDRQVQMALGELIRKMVVFYKKIKKDDDLREEFEIYKRALNRGFHNNLQSVFAKSNLLQDLDLERERSAPYEGPNVANEMNTAMIPDRFEYLTGKQREKCGDLTKQLRRFEKGSSKRDLTMEEMKRSQCYRNSELPEDGVPSQMRVRSEDLLLQINKMTSSKTYKNLEKLKDILKGRVELCMNVVFENEARYPYKDTLTFFMSSSIMNIIESGNELTDALAPFIVTLPELDLEPDKLPALQYTPPADLKSSKVKCTASSIKNSDESGCYKLPKGVTRYIASEETEEDRYLISLCPPKTTPRLFNSSVFCMKDPPNGPGIRSAVVPSKGYEKDPLRNCPAEHHRDTRAGFTICWPSEAMSLIK